MNEYGVSVCIIEYLMVVFVGMGLYNVVVEIDGFEVLIFDGSLVLFVWKIVEIGLKILNVFLCVIKVLEYVEVIDDEVKVLFLFV